MTFCSDGRSGRSDDHTAKSRQSTWWLRNSRDRDPGGHQGHPRASRGQPAVVPTSGVVPLRSDRVPLEPKVPLVRRDGVNRLGEPTDGDGGQAVEMDEEPIRTPEQPQRAPEVGSEPPSVSRLEG